MTGRIWILANQGEVGGGEVMLHHLATALRELGRDVGVVAPVHPAETADRLAADGFDVVRVGGPGRLGYLRALRAWDRGRGKDDVVWCNGLLPATVLDRAPRRHPDDRLLAIVAGMRHADSDLTLAGIATRLEQMRERTPRGNAKWFPSTVRLLLQRAEKKGMIMGAGER